MNKIFYFLVALLISQNIVAQTKTWNGSFSTNWFTAANWTNSGGAVVGVPTATDNVVINISTNAPVIQSGTPAVANSITISSTTGTLLTVNSGATLTVSKYNDNAIVVSNGTMVNNGTINATNTNPTVVSSEAALRMFSNGIVNNFGTITLNGGVNIGLHVSGANFVNKNGATLTSNGSNVIRLANPNSFFTNEINASISGTGTTASFFLNPGNFSNSGLVDVSGQVEIYGTSSNPTTFTNNACSLIKINGVYFNQSNSTTTNAGSMQISGNLNNNGTFTNNGSLVANTYPTYTNRRLQINNNAANNALFTISTLAGSTTINGIYLDQAATQSAGTYASGVFSPNMGGGVYTLYVKVTQGTCNYTIPFTYTRSRSRWYVKTAASGAGNGTSWANASGNLQAIINGTVELDSVWMASGIYKPLADASGNTAATVQKIFYTKSGVRIFGGFAGTETGFNQRNFKTNRTVFSGDIDNNDINTDGNNIAEIYTDIQGTNAYQLLAISSCNKNTMVDGIVFTAAKNIATTTPTQTINGTVITPDLGTAIHIVSSFPTIQNCIFSGNNSLNFGNFYQNNLSTAGTDTVKVNSSIFSGNYSEYGTYFLRRGNHLANNLVMYNNTGNQAGGIIVQINMPTTNTVDFLNSTFVNNYSNFGKSIRINGGTCKFINSIVYNATPYSDGNFVTSVSTVTRSYSILQNSLTSGTWNSNYGTDGGNNLDVNPLFTNISDLNGADNILFTADDGLALPNYTPGINRGTNTGITSNDITQNTRPYNAGAADIGAYEFQGGNPTAKYNTTLATGNWETVTNWTMGRLPISGETAAINQNHFITLIGTGNAKDVQLVGSGRIIYNSNISSLNIGF